MNIEGHTKKVRVIAFYLPQFHPIPENDEWWGNGFTEWTNVGKAKPLFRGHYQPRVPADLGYYDLRVSDVREQQAKMARYAGVEGFAYWHYWFGDGKRLLERPFNEVVESGNPDFPFCLAWANETWNGIWHGDVNRILIEQKYLGENDYINHFKAILPALKDKRYIRVEGKLLFYIYRPLNIPDTQTFFKIWQTLAKEYDLNGFYFVANTYDEKQAKFALDEGYNAVNSYWLKDALSSENKLKHYWNKFSEIFLRSTLNLPIWNYDHIAKNLISEKDTDKRCFPTILAGWDNSPRSGYKGRIFVNYNPENFDKHVKGILEITKDKPSETNLIFLKSWNEWAEGNYVEPDLRYGWQFLDVLNQHLY